MKELRKGSFIFRAKTNFRTKEVNLKNNERIMQKIKQNFRTHTNDRSLIEIWTTDSWKKGCHPDKWMPTSGPK